MSDLFSSLTALGGELELASAPPPSGLLQLPTELLIGIIAALGADHPGNSTSRVASLCALRLTCKYFSGFCAPALFRSVHLDEAKFEYHQRILENLGALVRDLTLNMKCGLADNEEQPIYDILWHMPNIRSLTIVHEREDTAYHTPLQRALDKLQHLEAVTLREKNYDPAFPYLDEPQVALSQTFFHRFLENILIVHGRRLQALHIYTLLPLDQALYVKIRDETPKLQSVTFSGNITVALREKFGEPTPWASGQTGSLKSIIIDTCEGGHAGYFAHNVLRGVYGTQLMEAGVIACGASDDEWFVPSITIQSLGSVDRFFIDHMFSWEMEALSRIPTRELSFTRLIPDNFIQLPNLHRQALIIHGWDSPA